MCVVKKKNSVVYFGNNNIFKLDFECRDIIKVGKKT